MMNKRTRKSPFLFKTVRLLLCYSKKYLITHTALDTWNTTEWKELIKPTVSDELTRLSYN